jgi:hypothetical protein
VLPYDHENENGQNPNLANWRAPADPYRRTLYDG